MINHLNVVYVVNSLIYFAFSTENFRASQFEIFSRYKYSYKFLNQFNIKSFHLLLYFVMISYIHKTRFCLHWLVYKSQRCLAKVRLVLQFYQINFIKFWIYWGCQEIYSFHVRLFHLTVMLADENIHKSRRLKSITCALC